MSASPPSFLSCEADRTAVQAAISMQRTHERTHAAHGLHHGSRRMPSARPLPAVLDFMQILWRVVHGVGQMSKRMSAQTGITGPQRLVLRLIGLRPGISASELAAMLHLHRGTVTGVLQRLEASGLLMRKTDAGDRRRALLTLTARGRRANALRAGTAEEAVAAALRGMTAHQKACARRALSAIADRVGSDD